MLVERHELGVGELTLRLGLGIEGHRAKSLAKFWSQASSLCLLNRSSVSSHHQNSKKHDSG